MQHVAGAPLNRVTLWRRKKREGKRAPENYSAWTDIDAEALPIGKRAAAAKPIGTTTGSTSGPRLSGGLTDQILLKFAGAVLTILRDRGAVPYQEWLLPLKKKASVPPPLMRIREPSEEVAGLMKELSAYNPAMLVTLVVDLSKLALKTRGAQIERLGESAVAKWRENANRDILTYKNSRSASSQGTPAHRVDIPGGNPISRRMVCYFKKRKEYRSAKLAIVGWLTDKKVALPKHPILDDRAFIPRYVNDGISKSLKQVRAGKLPMSRRILREMRKTNTGNPVADLPTKSLNENERRDNEAHDYDADAPLCWLEPREQAGIIDRIVAAISKTSHFITSPKVVQEMALERAIEKAKMDGYDAQWIDDLLKPT